jgi:hypothetical protein
MGRVLLLVGSFGKRRSESACVSLPSHAFTAFAIIMHSVLMLLNVVVHGWGWLPFMVVAVHRLGTAWDLQV